MLGVGWDTIRLFLHVLAATVWVGGQLTLAAMVPVLRTQGHEAPRAAARRFNLVAWPAYGVLIVTGIWNIAAVSPVTAAYRNTLILKLAVVAASGITAVLHARSKSGVGLAVWGALTGLTALAALFLGIVLGGLLFRRRVAAAFQGLGPLAQGRYAVSAEIVEHGLAPGHRHYERVNGS
jgi:putative copper export protein